MWRVTVLALLVLGLGCAGSQPRLPAQRPSWLPDDTDFLTQSPKEFFAKPKDNVPAGDTP
jgi:hypothetical protein